MPQLRPHPLPALLSLALCLPCPRSGTERLELSEEWRAGRVPELAVELVARAEREPLELVVVVGEERTRTALEGSLAVQEQRLALVDRPLPIEGREAPGRERCFVALERTRKLTAGGEVLGSPEPERSPLAGRCLRLVREGSGWRSAPGAEAPPEGLEAERLAAFFDPARLLPAEPPALDARWTLALEDLRALLLPSARELGFAPPEGAADRALAEAFERALRAELEARWTAVEERDGRRVARVELEGALDSVAEIEAPAGVRRALEEHSRLEGTLEWDLEARRPLALVLLRRGRVRLVEGLGAGAAPARRETELALSEERRLSWTP